MRFTVQMDGGGCSLKDWDDGNRRPFAIDPIVKGGNPFGCHRRDIQWFDNCRPFGRSAYLGGRGPNGDFYQNPLTYQWHRIDDPAAICE